MLCGDRKSVSRYSVGKQILLIRGETLNIWRLHAVFTVIPWKVNPIDALDGHLYSCIDCLFGCVIVFGKRFEFSAKR